MVRAQDAFAVSEGPLKQGDGTFEVAGRLVGVGEVVARRQRGGVVGAEDAFVVGEVAFVQGDGALTSAASSAAVPAPALRAPAGTDGTAAFLRPVLRARATGAPPARCRWRPSPPLRRSRKPSPP
ncbi:hypothetical protein Kpho02_59440 [Kitasatospora phosalacinea]|uniref:Uncharacterized protein n=1 Tax=Kitasatospora phosalacinea TaxID=2065 RepID=A0A9W6QBZ9_9ACTN|nr:hypothetical protein Kpho02_59440 [Kitasatospora phosalacinea]